MADDELRITRSQGLPGLILAGEIDESSYPVLVRSLAALGSLRDVHVDLGGVDYCDLAGLRAIIRAAGPDDAAEPAPGDLTAGRVVLHAVPGRLRRILQILGWDAMPGVGFDERRLPGGRDPVSARS